MTALRVLLVDDDPNQLEIINFSMGGEDQSLHLETAISADKALELLKEKKFDCVVSDYQMPRMNGVEFCEKLRGEGYEDSFVLFTCHDEDEVEERALKVGADDCLVKGENLSSISVLGKRIKDIVSRRRYFEGFDSSKFIQGHNKRFIHYLKA